MYYSPEHVATLLRRARAGGTRTRRLACAIFTFYGSYRFEKVHPLQSGAFRRKVRRTRRPGLPLENPVLFYGRRVWEFLSTYIGGAIYYLWLHRLRRRIERAANADSYTDAALAVSPGQAPDNAGRREVTAIPDFDPVKARDPAWRVAFKKNRARRNEDALAVLKGKTARGKLQVGTGDR
jgi:hypothetical protein